MPENIHVTYNSHVMQFIRYLSGWVYGFYMPLFFVLSGAVLALRPIDKFDTIVQSKIKRLLIPYFICGWLFMLPIKYIGNFYNRDSISQLCKDFCQDKTLTFMVFDSVILVFDCFCDY